jgi:ABC-type nitrate/sulfonate/bicarbonate transport system permease component
MRNRRAHRWFRVVDPLGILGLVVAIGIWYLCSWAIARNIPSPHAVLSNAFTQILDSTTLRAMGLPRGGYLPHLLFTARNVLLGAAAGALIGMLTGLASAESDWIDAIADPIVSLLGTVPIVVAAPFFLMWFGISVTAQFSLIAFYTAIVVHLFAYRGVKNQPPSFGDYAATLGAGRRQMFFDVRLPGALPEIFGGLRIALAAAWGLAAVTEMLGAQFGTGRVITALRSMYDLTGLLAVVLLLGIIAIACDLLLLALRRYVTRWAASGAVSSQTA